MIITKGHKFLKEFINLREVNQTEVVRKIRVWLTDHKIPYDHYDIFHDTVQFGLLHDFFPSPHILHLYPESEDKRVLIGKGVVFDSGGYDLKNDMKDMFYDKNGALIAIANSIDNQLPCLTFFVSNFINEYVVAGSILEDRYTGLNVLIDDTDAEGRIGLAHCIGLARELGYKGILTIATLTGHAHMVTGDRTYALVHSNQETNDLVDICSAATQTGLEIWPMPSHKEYDKTIDSKIIGADIRSCGSFKGAGSMTAFSFLKRFSKDTHHIHMDIASMMLDKNHNGYTKFGWKEIPYLLDLLEYTNCPLFGEEK